MTRDDLPSADECKSWVAGRYVVLCDQGVWKRRCRFVDCGKEYARGTSHMILKRHWSKAHGDVFSVEPRRRLNESNGGDQPTPKRQRSKSSGGDTSGPKKNKSQISMMGNSPMKKTLQEKLHAEFKLVIKRLREAISIHLTVELHVPKKSGKTYGIITAHSLNENFYGNNKPVRSVLLEHKHLPYPDDSTTVFEFIKSAVNKFSCREKIISIAANDTDVLGNAIEEYDKRHKLSKNHNFGAVHIRCFPYFVHVNVLQVFRSQRDLLDKIRKIINFINQNNFTMRPVTQADPNAPDGPGIEALAITNETEPPSGNETGAQVKKESTGLKLPTDNRSSWDTTYKMIDVFLEQRGFIEPTLQYFHNTQDLADVHIEWNRLFEVVLLLKPLYEVISKFAHDDYTPVSTIAALIPHLMDHFSDFQSVHNDVALAANRFKTQLDLYRQQFQSDLTVIAGLLDPRIKDSFTSVEGRQEVMHILRKRVEEHPPSPPPPKSSASALKSNAFMRALFIEANPDEIARYMDSSREVAEADPANYWECHKYAYPSLYNLARSLLSVQASSVPGERMFAAAEMAAEDRRGQLDNSVSKELIRSWSKYLEN